MSPEPKPRTFKDRALLIAIFYESPWERLSTFLLGVYRDGREEYRWIIPEHPAGWWKVLLAIATRAEQRDVIWRAKYAVRNRNPPARWKRGTGNGDPEA